ncbi:dihydrofolate reductase family protein [Nitratireductor pacificus]|uniref:Pyrimidine reductase (Dihydrofolate reductase family) protein n=1 Tax=Nitratireductor pacificus pht-3B TaxID=391937 RepID=K2M5J8_9HYPH|nr:dihydrofolate reductase family protein [Nitratireductor pacificus]EKF17421.1 pyrimidine reductase (dihydrofolate reductase family) protein [Nitratireductor pacificus pht-3B]
MNKVIIWNLVTLDGYFEGEKKWDLGFHGHAWGDELEALSKAFGESAAVLVFGRVTYEGMKAHWTSAAASEETSEVTGFMNALPKLVASRTITRSDWNNTQVTDDIVGAIRAVKEKAAPGKNVYVFGSADLCASLLEAGIVDEVMLAHVPVLLGKGTPFFKPGGAERTLTLIEARPLRNGTVITRHAPA